MCKKSVGMFAIQNQWAHLNLKLIKIAFGKKSKKADKSYEIVFLILIFFTLQLCSAGN